MSAPLPPSSQNGNATNSVQPRDIIYLDRGRLFSYASQLHDGLTMMRRVLTLAAAGEVIEKDTLDTEKISETRAQGAAGVEVPVKLGGEFGKTNTIRQNKGTGGGRDSTFSGDFFAEEKSELDNLFLLVENELEEKGLLRNFDGTHRGGLVRFKSSAKLLDSSLFTGMVEQIEAISMLPGVTDPGIFGLMAVGGTDLAKILRLVMPNDFVFYFKSLDRVIMAPLNSNHLTIDPGQLRAAFLNGTYELTLIAFVPQRTMDSFVLPGSMGQIDFKSIMTSFTGDPDITVIPVALYANLV